MRIRHTTFLLCMISTGAFAGAGGNIGTSDNRTYGSLQDPLYSAIGRISIGCTAGFIDNNLIITNHHCFVACQNKCTVTFWDGTQYRESAITPVAVPRANENQSSNGTDWIVYKTEIPNPSVKTIAPKSTLGDVSRGGFGLLRVIKDSEIPELKQIYAQVTRERKAECQQKYPSDGNKILACIHKYVTQELTQRGIEPLFQDSKNFKVQECTMHTFVDNNRRVRTDCDSAGGDSGAPLLRGNVIVGLNNAGPQTVFSNNDANGALALNTDNFYGPIMTIKKLMQNNGASAVTEPANNQTPVTVAPQPTTEPTAPQPAATPEPQLVTEPAQIQQFMMDALNNFKCD